jgi:GNAT superfamily N-acetyltransferase
MKHDSVVIRRATLADREALRAMQAFSISVLGVDFYAPQQIAAFICHVGTLDDFLLHEGTFYLAESGGAVVASGGWSRRRPNYANAMGEVERPGAVVPKIRGVFVHPAFARRGIASALMARAEAEALAAGYREVELTATLSGVPLYRKLGYAALRPITLHLPDGVAFPGLMMRKQLREGRDALTPSVARAS